jgi:hypothetical protein
MMAKPRALRAKSHSQEGVTVQVAENCPPVVISSRRESGAKARPGRSKEAFEPLFAYAKTGSRAFVITRNGQTVKLAWPGVQVTPSQLAELLRTLPAGRRLDGATRFGSRVATLSFDGKLRRGRLAPPSQEGMVLVWTEPEGDLSELDQVARKTFEPQGECLGRLVLETTTQRAVARIYRNPEQRSPGFVLLRQGEVVRENDWLQTLERPEEARLCQVVVEGDLPWEGGIPSAFLGRFQKLARLAAQKSKEMLETLPSPNENRALIPALLDSPKLATLLEARRGQLPPLPTIGQILEMLQLSGGRRRVSELREALGIPQTRFEEILLQTDSVLRNDEQVCLSRSLDGEWLLLHQDILIRLFDLNPEARASDGLVSATDLNGRKRSVDVPVELEPKERRVVEALLRYGRLSERELSQLVGSRRVGGLLEKLVGRLEAAGSFLVRVAGNSDDGRIYEVSAS